MSDIGGEKKHSPTPSRRRKAREQGRMARSQDLSSALVLLLAMAFLNWTGPGIAKAAAAIMHDSLSADVQFDLDTATVASRFASHLNRCLLALLPLFAGVCGIVLVNNWMQSGFLLFPGKLSLDWTRVDPLAGARRVAGAKNLAQSIFGMVKVGLVLAVAVLSVSESWRLIVSTPTMSTLQIASLIWSTVIRIGFQVGFVLLVLALADYGFQWWQHERSLMMTDEELREEMKAMGSNSQRNSERATRQDEMLHASNSVGGVRK